MSEYNIKNNKSIIEDLRSLILKQAIENEYNLLNEIERLGITTKEAIHNYHLEMMIGGKSKLVLNKPQGGTLR